MHTSCPRSRGQHLGKPTLDDPKGRPWRSAELTSLCRAQSTPRCSPGMLKEPLRMHPQQKWKCLPGPRLASFRPRGQQKICHLVHQAGRAAPKTPASYQWLQFPWRQRRFTPILLYEYRRGCLFTSRPEARRAPTCWRCIPRSRRTKRSAGRNQNAPAGGSPEGCLPSRSPVASLLLELAKNCTTQHRKLSPFSVLACASIAASSKTASTHQEAAPALEVHIRDQVGWKCVFPRGVRTAMPPRRRAAAAAAAHWRRSVRPRLAESANAGSPAPMVVPTVPVPAAGPARGSHEGDAGGAAHSGQARH